MSAPETSHIASALQKGTILDSRYEISGLLGWGDFGTVYQARDLQDDGSCPYVAIKQMPMQSIVDCERQADVRGAMQHPTIPRIYGYFGTDSHAYLVQELIVGQDLESVLENQSSFLPEEMVLAWGIQLCEFLDYVHNHPVYPLIFRDMKPNNVMVDQANRIHVVDFGLARVFPPGYFQAGHPQLAHLGKGLAMGTVGYSPPEQYEGNVKPQSDIFALGATLYHLLTRRDPRRNPEFTFDQFPVRALNPSVSVEFSDAVMRSLALDIDRRFSSAREMQRALQSAQTSLAQLEAGV
jgi:eukaryotic-like serine/threonine-protein kinase